MACTTGPLLWTDLCLFILSWLLYNKQRFLLIPLLRWFVKSRAREGKMFEITSSRDTCYLNFLYLIYRFSSDYITGGQNGNQYIYIFKKKAHWFDKAWYSTLRLVELGWHNLGQTDDNIKGQKKPKPKKMLRIPGKSNRSLSSFICKSTSHLTFSSSSLKREYTYNWVIQEAGQFSPLPYAFLFFHLFSKIRNQHYHAVDLESITVLTSIVYCIIC